MSKKAVLVPRHNPFVGIVRDEPALPVHAVRRGQARLGADPVVREITEYAHRKTWWAVAGDLAKHYFPRSFRDNNTHVAEAVTWLYLYALLFYPRQFRLKGTYRPDWTRATLLSWFRRSVGPHTRQWWAAALRLDEPTDIGRAVENAKVYLRIENADAWLTETLTFLDGQAQESGRRGDLARLIYLPVALAHVDAAWRERTQFDALPHRRKVRRALKEGTVGYVRRGRDVWMVADRHARMKLPELPWVDLRAQALEVRDYRLRWRESERGAGVCIEIKDEVVKTLAAQVKVALAGGGTPQFRLHRLNQLLDDFLNTHRRATGAGRQMFLLDRWVFQQVRRTLMPHYPEAGKRLTCLKGKLDNTLALPRPNLFLDPAQVPEVSWRAMFSPWR